VAFELELIPTNSGSNTKKYKEMNRRISINTIGYAVPQSFITKSKQRLKQHTDTVYLNNGDEFEIELYNPTQNKVLAKIEMNGKPIGSGIILRPGERIFLERYLDEAKKFLFETYVVNGNNEEVQQSIVHNGDVTVKFYNEYLSTSNTQYNVNSGTVTINNPNFGWGSTTTGSPYYGNGTFTTSGTNLFYNTSLTSGTVSTNSFLNNPDKVKKSSRDLETGRVEKGSYSNQSFTYDNSSFNSYPSTTNWWKIKPQSQKMVTIEDLVTYCTECGSKRKKDNHKFCPHCGTKF
jgi:hypothetical protein